VSLSLMSKPLARLRLLVLWQNVIVLFAFGTLPVSFLTSGRFPIADAKLVQKSGVVKHLVRSPYIFTDFYVLKHCFSV
ncbi:MAG: hypothetical protein K2M13_03175, partial [Muribaculaceae bacterium]|nr:hypothetical protein [Muribaculaceae bacterium]